MEQLPDLRSRFLFQPGLIVHLVLLKRLSGIQSQNLYLFLRSKQVAQSRYPLPDTLCGENRVIIRVDQEEHQAAAWYCHAVGQEFANTHQLPRGLTLLQPFALFPFLKPLQGSSLHSYLCCWKIRKQAARRRKSRILAPST